MLPIPTDNCSSQPWKEQRGATLLLLLSWRGADRCPGCSNAHYHIRPEDAQGTQQLYLHINTVQQRISKAQSLVTGKDESISQV